MRYKNKKLGSHSKLTDQKVISLKRYHSSTKSHLCERHSAATGYYILIDQGKPAPCIRAYNLESTEPKDWGLEIIIRQLVKTYQVCGISLGCASKTSLYRVDMYGAIKMNENNCVPIKYFSSQTAARQPMPKFNATHDADKISQHPQGTIFRPTNFFKLFICEIARLEIRVSPDLQPIKIEPPGHLAKWIAGFFSDAVSGIESGGDRNGELSFDSAAESWWECKLEKRHGPREPSKTLVSRFERLIIETLGAGGHNCSRTREVPAITCTLPP